ncbi:MAG TPA: hypothetical protein PLK31_02055, partial [Chloroflexota bacterium]|nr:hypothetical protein [Chloroflexota bacterium]
MAEEQAIFPAAVGERSVQPDAAFPATAIWNGNYGPAAPQEGSHSLVLGNLGHGASLTSPAVTAPAVGSPLTVQMQIQKDLSQGDGVALVVNYYDDAGHLLNNNPSPIWHSDQLANSTGWQTVSATDTVPPNAIAFTLSFHGSFYDGWIAFNDVSAAGVTWDFDTPTWTAQSGGDFPAGAVWHGPVNTLGLPGHVPDYGQVYAFTNRARASAVTSTWFDVIPFQSYQIDAWVRGQFATVVGNGKLWLEYGSGNTVVGRVAIGPAVGLNTTAWQPVSQNITVPAYADRFRLVVVAERLGGWLALDDVSVLNTTQHVSWDTGDSWAVSLDAGLPGSAAAGNSSLTATHTGSGASLTLHNLASGVLQSDPIPLSSGVYYLNGWTNYRLASGGASAAILLDNGAVLELGKVTLGSAGYWTPFTLTFTVPTAVASAQIRLQATDLDGWVAFDDLTLANVLDTVIFAATFEDAAGWAAIPDADYPATAMGRGGAGPATPHSGAYSFLMGNLAQATITSPRVDVAGLAQLKFGFKYQTQFPAMNGGQLTFTASYYDALGRRLVSHDLWFTQNSVSAVGQISVTDSGVPAGTQEVELLWRGEQFHGSIILDDVTVTQPGSNQVIVYWDLNEAPEALGWSSSSPGAFPGSAAWWQVTYLPLNMQEGDYRLSNQAGGVWQSGLFPAAAGQSYHLHAYLRGQASLNEPAQ